MHCHAIPCHPSDFGSPVSNLQGRTREEPLPTSAKGATKSQVERHEKTQSVNPNAQQNRSRQLSWSGKFRKCLKPRPKVCQLSWNTCHDCHAASIEMEKTNNRVWSIRTKGWTCIPLLHEFSPGGWHRSAWWLVERERIKASKGQGIIRSQRGTAHSMSWYVMPLLFLFFGVVIFQRFSPSRWFSQIVSTRFFAEFGEVREFLASEGYLSSRAKALQLRSRKSGSETTQEKNVSLVYEDENVWTPWKSVTFIDTSHSIHESSWTPNCHDVFPASLLPETSISSGWSIFSFTFPHFWVILFKGLSTICVEVELKNLRERLQNWVCRVWRKPAAKGSEMKAFFDQDSLTHICHKWIMLSFWGFDFKVALCTIQCTRTFGLSSIQSCSTKSQQDW